MLPSAFISHSSIVSNGIVGLKSIEGQNFGGPVATFTVALGQVNMTAATATILWLGGNGGGMSENVTPSLSGNSITVSSGGHTFDDEGIYLFVATLSVDGMTSVASGSVKVADAPLIGSAADIASQLPAGCPSIFFIPCSTCLPTKNVV